MSGKETLYNKVTNNIIRELEATVVSAKAFLYAAFVMLLTRRLARKP